MDKEYAIKVIKDEDFTAKILPEGYLSIRYKNYDCYGQMVDVEISDKEIEEAIKYIKEVYDYREEPEVVSEAPASKDDSSDGAKESTKESQNDDSGVLTSDDKEKVGFTKKTKMNFKIKDQDFSEVPNDLSFNYVWGTMNRVDKNILKNKVLAHIESLKLREEYDRIELMIKYEIPYEIIQAIYYDIDEKELKLVYKRLTRPK